MEHFSATYLDSKNHHRVQQHGEQSGTRCSHFTNAFGDNRGAHRSSRMATAHKLMHIQVAQLEEPLCLPVSITTKTVSAQDGILKGHGKGRIVASHPIPYCSRSVLGLRKRVEVPIRCSFQELYPSS